ncbi:MAG: helix-hairpin-helix domain-containing protein [Cyanobacteriota bacterium]
MDYSEEARKRIIEYLRIKPINHGQVHVLQIAIPEVLTKSLDPVKVEMATASLKRFGSNLHPVLLRRTALYGEDREYEVVFGEEWCEAASRLGWERIWAWIFDIPDDQIDDIRRFMEEVCTRSSTTSGSAIDSANTQDSHSVILNKVLSEVRSEISNLRREIEEKFDQLFSRLPAPPQLKNINNATEVDLSSLDNPVVKKKARQIYQFIREQNGIATLEELKAIKGIGDKTIAYLKGIFSCS